MILSKLFAVLLGCTSAVLALDPVQNELAPKQAKMRRLTRRDGVEDCTKALAADTWSHRAPDQNISAAICYDGAYTVSNSSPNGKIFYNQESCSYKNWIGEERFINYDCFWMSNSNTFTAQGGGGYRNLAMVYGMNCNWDHSSKSLYCTD